MMKLMQKTGQAPSLPTSRKVLCAAYAAIAIAALIGTWGQNLAYRHGVVDFLGSFLRDTKVTPASRSIMADIVLFFLAAAILMVIEARKHGVRFVWAYVVGGLVIAISVTFPLFLLARELRMNSSEAPSLRVTDTILLILLAVWFLGMTVWVDAG